MGKTPFLYPCAKVYLAHKSIAVQMEETAMPKVSAKIHKDGCEEYIATGTKKYINRHENALLQFIN